VYHREKAYNSFNPVLRCDSPLSSQMSEKSTTPGRELGMEGCGGESSGEEDEGKASMEEWKWM